RSPGSCAVDPNNIVSEVNETNNACADIVLVLNNSSIPSGSSMTNYIPNLNLGDSFVNITNTGAAGAGLSSGTAATIIGALCANVYVFSPDEQMISCCSCPVTPGGLVSLSAQQDLISNTLTPASPNSVVVKLVATVPQGGTCNNSAAGVSSG